MGSAAANIAFLVAFAALPIATFLFVRSLAWATIAVIGSVSIAGTLIGFAIEYGHRWTFLQLQVVLLLALAVVAAVAFWRRRPARVAVRHQLLAVVVPFLALGAFFAFSRMAARSRSGGLTAVGYFIDHVSSEDNAKWLDFAGQAVTGDHINQGIYLGGALQLVIVLVATALAVVSSVLLGGVNEVFVAANSVVYSQFLLVSLVPFALTPLAEARLSRTGPDGKRVRWLLPAPVIWAGIVVIATAATAIINLGHFTLQWILILATLWIATFIVPVRMRHARLLTSMAIVTSAAVWFPMVPISIVVMAAFFAWLVAAVVRGRSLRSVDWFAWALWLVVAITMARPLKQTLLYMADQGAPSAAGAVGGGVRAVATAIHVPALDLLVSQGGTEAAGPVMALLAAATAVLAAIFVTRWRSSDSRWRMALRFAPGIVLIAYALALTLLGTWWAGKGPGYGAVKVTFMVSVAVLTVAVPLAIAELDRKRTGMSVVKWVAVGAVIYLLAIDGIMPRALSITSPQRWPALNSAEDPNYWWPAEVRPVAEQNIADSPIGCAYFPQGATAPTALPNGQTAYNCTRILAGLNGADATAQPLVDWARREWLTNEGAWTAVWPDLVTMPADVRGKRLILLDDYDNVVGFETVNAMLDRFRPEWAVGQPLESFTNAPAS